MTDLSREFRVESYCFEVSARGQLSKANKARLKSFLLECTGLKRQSAVQLFANVSKAALLGSFSIFSARNEASRNVGRDLSGQRLNLSGITSHCITICLSYILRPMTCVRHDSLPLVASYQANNESYILVGHLVITVYLMNKLFY